MWEELSIRKCSGKYFRSPSFFDVCGRTYRIRLIGYHWPESKT